MLFLSLVARRRNPARSRAALLRLQPHDAGHRPDVGAARTWPCAPSSTLFYLAPAGLDGQRIAEIAGNLQTITQTRHECTFLAGLYPVHNRPTGPPYGASASD